VAVYGWREYCREMLLTSMRHCEYRYLRVDGHVSQDRGNIEASTMSDVRMRQSRYDATDCGMFACDEYVCVCRQFFLGACGVV
jgi:hypothetical protein